ncbi:MAG: hypothetical protein LBR52_04150 [Prevotellaceae bacterium]|jgi:hypothetical protein|nr:hypothetical protein [Prevotellaceae bacterium]
MKTNHTKKCSLILLLIFSFFLNSAHGQCSLECAAGYTAYPVQGGDGSCACFTPDPNGGYCLLPSLGVVLPGECAQEEGEPQDIYSVPLGSGFVFLCLLSLVMAGIVYRRRPIQAV